MQTLLLRATRRASDAILSRGERATHSERGTAIAAKYLSGAVTAAPIVHLRARPKTRKLARRLLGSCVGY